MNNNNLFHDKLLLFAYISATPPGMNPPFFLFIEPIDFLNTLQFNTQYNYLSIQSSFNKTKHKEH